MNVFENRMSAKIFVMNACETFVSGREILMSGQKIVVSGRGFVVSV